MKVALCFVGFLITKIYLTTQIVIVSGEVSSFGAKQLKVSPNITGESGDFKFSVNPAYGNISWDPSAGGAGQFEFFLNKTLKNLFVSFTFWFSGVMIN